MNSTAIFEHSKLSSAQFSVLLLHKPQIRLREQAPDLELPRIRMGFLEVIHLHRDGQLALAGRLGPPAFVRQARKVLVVKPREDGIHGRPGHLQYPTAADLIPPLIVQPGHSRDGRGRTTAPAAPVGRRGSPARSP